MGFYINFCTNVMSGLTLLCADLRFGLSPASSPLQSPFRSSFSLLLDFLTSPLLLKVQSSAISRPFWTSSCLLSTSRSNPPLFLTPFGLPRISPPLQSPFCHSCSLLLDFFLPPLHFKVHSAALSRSFWTSSCLLSTSRSNPPLFLTPFGLPRASPPPQSPFRHAPAPHHAKKADCKAIRQSHSGNSNPAILIRQSNSTISMPVISQFHQVKHLQ